MKNHALVTFMHTNEDGFNFIEVMVVVAIIGITSAIAVPVYKAYQIRAHVHAALSDVRLLRSPIEAKILGVGSSAPFATVGPNISLTFPGEETLAKITAKRDQGSVTLIRSASGKWLCEHTFDTELEGCEKAPPEPETTESMLSDNQIWPVP